MGSIFLSQDQHTRARTPTSGKAGRGLFSPKTDARPHPATRKAGRGVDLSKPRPTPASPAHKKWVGWEALKNQDRHPCAPRPTIQAAGASTSRRPRNRRLDLGETTAQKTRSRAGQGPEDSISRRTWLLGLDPEGSGLRRLDLGETTAPKTRSRGGQSSEDSISARRRL